MSEPLSVTSIEPEANWYESYITYKVNRMLGSLLLVVYIPANS